MAIVDMWEGVGAPLAALGDRVRIRGIGFDLPPAVVSSALRLTLGTTAHDLVGTKTRGPEQLLAITTVAIVHQAAPDRDADPLL